MSAGAAPPTGTLRTGRVWSAGAIVAMGLAALAVLVPEGGARLRTAWFDALQRLAPRHVASMPAVVVAIDERSIAAVGRWPWPRHRLAELVAGIAAHDPAAIAVDVLMPEPDPLSPERLLAGAGGDVPAAVRQALAALPSNDAVLARALAGAPSVLVVAGMPDATGRLLRAVAFAIDDASARQRPATAQSPPEPEVARFAGALTSLPELDRAASGWGLISLEPDAGVIRRIPLVANVGGTLVPALAVEVLRVASGARNLRLRVAGSRVEGIAFGDVHLPTEGDGAVHVHFAPSSAARFVSAVDVLDGRIAPERFARKLVLVSVTGLGLGDVQATPLGQRMPGSEIHAQLLESLFDGTTLIRPAWAALAELAAFGLLAALVVVLTPRLAPRNAALLALSGVGLLATGAFALFRARHLLLDAATPGVGVLLVFGSVIVLSLAEAHRQRRALAHALQVQREESARIEGELAAARRIQTGTLPRAEHFRDDRRLDLAATMAPATEVGGDLYDFFRLDERRLFLIVGDVAGKGLSASIFMAVSKALAKASMLRTPAATVAALLSTANVEIARDNPEFLFVTAFAGILDLDTGELEFGNAGHEPPWAVHAEDRTARRVEGEGGPPLCVVDDYAYSASRYRMRPGELLVVVSDGVTEAMDPSGALYGGRRVAARLMALRADDTSAGAIVDGLLADARAFAAGADPRDDMTVLALRWRGPEPAASGS